MVGSTNRRISFTKAIRKRKLDEQICHYDDERGYGWYDNLHQYSKNKIHCSCSMCSAKTRNKGNSKHKGKLPTICYKTSDRRKIDRVSYVD